MTATSDLVSRLPELFGFPVTSKFFTTAHGARMHYVEMGPSDGPVLVMVHGNPSWSFYWRKLIEAFAPTHRCIVPDHIGMGCSDKPEDYPYHITRRVRDLSDLLDHCGVESDATLLVHDWGGMIGFGAAVAKPERFAKFVVTNTGAFHLPVGKSFPWQLHASRLPGLGDFMVRGLNGFCRYAVKHCVKRQPMSSEAERGLLAPYDTWGNRVAVHRFVQDIPLVPGDAGHQYISSVDEKLHLFKDHPMLITWGLQDFVFDKHFLQAWTDRFPEAKVHSWDDGGHYILEDYGDEITALVKDFLA